jgi:hypothetical protein
MIAALSPAASNYDETLGTLKFADRVASITTTTKADVNEEAAEIQKLQSEIEKLKGEIEEAKKGKVPGGVVVVKKRRERPPRPEGAEGEEGPEDDWEEEEEIDDEEAIRQLEAFIRSNEERMQEMNQSPEEMKAQAAAAMANQKKALEDHGLSTDEIMDRFSIDKNAIYLINISADPSIANQLLYFLKPGTNTVGNDTKNNIILKGLGIQDLHVTIHRQESE